jgi:uncharacterized protein (TIGR03118 family)
MRRSPFLAALGGLVLLAATPVSARADFVQTNLVSDVQGLGQITDPNLVNPWGVSFSATSPFWVSNQGTGTSTLYTVTAGGVVTQNGLIVTIPQAATPPRGPTGQVSNSTTGFLVGTTPASFIFANLDGSISAWNGSAGTTAQLKVNPAAGSVYTGLAIANPASGPLLYAANSGQGRIDVYNGSFVLQNLGANAFRNPQLPAGLVPFNVQNIGGQIYVTYAIPGQAARTVDEGSGAVAIFDLNGNFIRQVTAGGKLASPWGITLAPTSFGEFGGDLLIGNFNDAHGEINAFDPVTGAYLGTLTDTNGNVIINPGLWALAFGNGGSGGSPNTLFFSAGIAGETHGLFGSLQAVPEPSTAALALVGGLILVTVRRRRARTA